MYHRLGSLQTQEFISPVLKTENSKTEQHCGLVLKKILFQGADSQLLMMF